MSRKAFTLIELLVVISIIALLSSVVLASLNSARDKGRLAAGKQFSANLEHAAGDYAMGIWDFNECSGGALADSSGNGNNGALVGSPTWSTDTPTGTGCSLQFNGSTQYVSVPDSSTLRLTGDATYSAWVKPTSLPGGWADVMDKECASFGIWVSTTNTVYGVQCGSPTVPSSGGALSLNVWHQVTGVYTNGNIKIYIDGAVMGSNGGSPVITSTQPLTIGKGHDGYFTGYIDRVRVFAKGYTAQEVRKLYADDLKNLPLAASR